MANQCSQTLLRIVDRVNIMCQFCAGNRNKISNIITRLDCINFNYGFYLQRAKSNKHESSQTCQIVYRRASNDVGGILFARQIAAKFNKNKKNISLCYNTLPIVSVNEEKWHNKHQFAREIRHIVTTCTPPTKLQ